MIPNSWVSFILFLIFVAPGVRYLLLSRKRRTLPKESAFMEISRAVVASVLIGIPSLTTILLIWMWTTGNQPDVSFLLSLDTKNVLPILSALTGYLVLSFSGAYIANFVMTLKQQGNTPIVSDESLWTKALNNCPEGTDTVAAQVTMKNGEIWFGQVAHFSTEHANADREIMLGGEIQHQASASELPEEEACTSVILSGSEIASVAVEYFKSEEASVESPKKFRGFSFAIRVDPIRF